VFIKLVNFFVDHEQLAKYIIIYRK